RGVALWTPRTAGCPGFRHRRGFWSLEEHVFGEATMISYLSASARPRDGHAEPHHNDPHRESVRSTTEVARVADAVAAAMAAAGYTDKDVFGMRLALEEAIVNAVKHGHQGDATKEVQVRYRVTPQQVLVEVEDQGPGFDPSEVPDPLAPENLERPSG